MACTSRVPWARMVQTWYRVALVSLPEAQKLLGLTSRTTIYRKAKTGELPTVPDANGRPLVESDGLAELWGRIVQEQPKITSRRQAPVPAAPLDPPPALVTPQPIPAPPLAASPPPPAPRSRAIKTDDVVEPPSGSADFDENGVPVYNVQRAWAEYEKRLHEHQKRALTTLQRQELERQLYRRETVEQAWGRAVNMARTKVLGVPSRAKQQIPHLSPDEVELLRDLLREALAELAAGEVTND